MINKKLLDNLICIKCFGKVVLKEDKLVCTGCRKKYLVADNKPHMIGKQGKGFSELSSDVTINKLKVFFKRYPNLFSIFYYLFGASFVGKSPQKAIKNIGEDRFIINLGSGIKRIRDDIINIDFYPFVNVDVVADIVKLPLKDKSVDVVISEFVLEHVKNPQAVIKEAYRVLKLGGLVYIAVPFVASFHSSPDDYYRWSKEGLKELMGDFKEVELGVRCGPTSGMLSIINEWLATLFSFGSKNLHQILLMFFTVITFPVKFLDYLISKFPTSKNIASGFYFIGKKK